MSGGLPIKCPDCDSRTVSCNRRGIEAPKGNDGGLQQYRKCTNPKCPRYTATFKAIITWTVG